MTTELRDSMASSTGKITFIEVRDAYLAVLNEIERRGVKWRGTRLNRYLDDLNVSATWSFPRDEGKRLPVFYDAINQAQLLTGAAKVWAQLDPRLLAPKLKLIAEGPYGVPGGDDRARNTMFELWSAAALAGPGCSVRITDGGADVELLVDVLAKPIAVECKRPAGKDGIDRAIRDGRRQLLRRRDHGAGYGMLLLGTDRALRYTPGGRVEIDGQELNASLAELSGKWAQDIVEHAKRSGRQLHPAVTLVGAAIMGTFFSTADGLPYTVERIGFTDNGQASARELATVLDGRIGRLLG